MTYLLRLSACLFLCVSLNSFGAYVFINEGSQHIAAYNSVSGIRPSFGYLSENGSPSYPNISGLASSENHLYYSINGDVSRINVSDPTNGNWVGQGSFFSQFNRESEYVASLNATDGLAYGEGFLYFSNNGNVSRYDLETSLITNININNATSGLAYGNDTLYFSNNGNVSRYDLSSNVVEDININNATNGIAFGGGYLFYSNSDGYVVKFNINNESEIVIGYLDAMSGDSLAYQKSPVPLPAGIYLFLSGLVGLGLMKGRNG